MATITAEDRTAVITLTANTFDTVTLSGADANRTFKFVEVSNWGTTRLSFTVNGVTPTVDGAGCYHVGGGQALLVPSPQEPDVIKLISSGTPSYSVAGSN